LKPERVERVEQSVILGKILLLNRFPVNEATRYLFSWLPLHPSRNLDISAFCRPALYYMNFIHSVYDLLFFDIDLMVW